MIKIKKNKKNKSRCFSQGGWKESTTHLGTSLMGKNLGRFCYFNEEEFKFYQNVTNTGNTLVHIVCGYILVYDLNG
jgi:hypothetical protein